MSELYNNDVAFETKKQMDEKLQGLPMERKSDGVSYEKHFYIESYGCAMNFADSETTWYDGRCARMYGGTTEKEVFRRRKNC